MEVKLEQQVGRTDVKIDNSLNPSRYGILIGIGSEGSKILSYSKPLFNNKGFTFLEIVSESDVPNGKERIQKSVGEVAYLMVCLGDEVSKTLLHEMAKVCKELGKIVVAIVAMPHQDEIGVGNTSALEDLVHLKQFVDTFFVFYKEDLQDGNASLELSKEVFFLPIEAILKIIHQKGGIVVDESDVKLLLTSGTFSAVGIGQSKQLDRITHLFEQVLGSPYLKSLDKEKCTLILLSIGAREQDEINMDEIEQCCDVLKKQFGKKFEIIIGIECNNVLGDCAKLVCMFAFPDDALLPLKKEKYQESTKINFVK